MIDVYNLINSKAISKHCRKINHKFNTEELAVLIFRNKRMNVDEKISAYQELISDYPDMEVIKRFNCEHYDSVKDMIKEEITRIQDLRKILEKDEEDVVYTYNYWSNDKDKIRGGKDEYRDIYKTFKEVQKEIDNDLKEDEEKEIISFRIRKRQFSKDSKYDIIAEYKLNENRKLEIVNIYDHTCEGLNIGYICLNIPTPFKKGDLLVSTSQTPFGEAYVLDYERFPFVLDNLITWNDKFQKMLAKGNFDSSDMQGPGYLITEYGELDYDNVFDYDSWEYFEGNLQREERILKGISSLMKNEIGVNLFIRAYEHIKSESNDRALFCFTEEGLQKAGLSEEKGEKV